MEKIAVFLDSNVLFSAAYSGTGQSLANLLFELQDQGLIQIYVSEFFCQEARYNLRRKKPSQAGVLEALISKASVLQDTAILHGHPALDKLPHADRLILSTAIANKIRVFLTGNERDFVDLYGTRLGTTIVLRPADFLNRRF